MTPQPDPQAGSPVSSYDELYDLHKAIGERYHKNLIDTLQEPDHDVTRYVLGRGITPDDIARWKLGYAPNEWKFMTERMIEKGAFNLAVDLGVCAIKNERNFDVFRHRLLIPRHDEQGRWIGFSGRSIGEPEAMPDGGKAPKYLNTRETVLFRKSEVLFGLHKAIKQIRKSKHVTLTEGDFDVVSLHAAGVTDAIGKGGTALTDEQVKTLLRLASRVTLIYDEDINEAGQKALERDLDRLLREGLRVKVFRLPQPEANKPTMVADPPLKPVKVDADSWVQQYYMPARPDLPLMITQGAKDGLMLTAGRLLQTEELDARIDGVETVVDLLFTMGEGTAQTEYVKQISKSFDINPKELSRQLTAKKKAKEKAAKRLADDDDEDDDELPEWVDRKEFFTWGFAPRRVEKDKMKTGYYFSSGLQGLDHKPLTNFIIKPLYHIKDQGNVRRLIEIDNGVLHRIMEVNAKFLLTLPAFEETLSELGHFVVDTGFERKHLKRIANYIMDQTPEVFPVKTLGYQPEGFFAFSNAVFNGHLENYNGHGVVKVEDKHYFSPALSPIAANYRQDGDDKYKYDKYLSYHQAPVGFNQWAKQMQKVYGDRAMAGVVFAVVALFKDVVRQYSKIPLLYCYGPKDSGKSQFAESIMYLFFSGKDSDGKLISSLNLGSSPTTSAFWTAMSRFRNCPYVFNEFDDQRIDRWVFSAFKSAWDGEGRTRQSKEDKHLTEEQAVHCAPILVGQYLSTQDDGSVTSRSLVFEFANRKDTPFTAEETANFDLLKDWQRAGLNGILTELLPHRPLVVEHFKSNVRRIKDELTAKLEEEKQRSSPRTIENVSCLLAMYDTLSGVIEWPMSRADLWAYSRQQIGQLASLMQESDALGNFWNMTEYLLDRGDLVDGWDFRIDTKLSVKGKVAAGQTEEIVFDKPTQLLYIRMLNVHKPYAEYTRKGSNEQPHKQQTLEIYLRQQAYYVCETRGVYFAQKDGVNTITTCFVLRYDLLVERTNVNLERYTGGGEEKPLVTYAGQLMGPVKPHPSAGVLEFRLQVTHKGSNGIEQFSVKCFTAATELAGQLTENSYWKATGQLTEKSWHDGNTMRSSRQLDVQQLEAVSSPALYASGYNEPLEKGKEGF